MWVTLYNVKNKRQEVTQEVDWSIEDTDRLIQGSLKKTKVKMAAE